MQDRLLQQQSPLYTKLLLFHKMALTIIQLTVCIKCLVAALHRKARLTSSRESQTDKRASSFALQTTGVQKQISPACPQDSMSFPFLHISVNQTINSSRWIGNIMYQDVVAVAFSLDNNCIDPASLSAQQQAVQPRQVCVHGFLLSVWEHIEHLGPQQRHREFCVNVLESWRYSISEAGRISRVSPNGVECVVYCYHHQDRLFEYIIGC